MIHSLSKQRLKQLTKLHQKKHRDTQKLFLATGLRTVQQLLTKQDQCVELIIDEEKSDLLFELNAREISAIPQYSLAPKEFFKLVEEKNPQGICLVVKKPDRRLEQIEGNEILFLDRISDPGNLGTIIRSAAWFGISAILLSDLSADPFQLKVTRSTAGTILDIPIYENAGKPLLMELKNKGYSLIATDVNNGEKLQHFHFGQKKVILLGSEAHGLDKLLCDMCEKVCYIKRFGSGESLNLSSAASIIMYQVTAQNKY